MERRERESENVGRRSDDDIDTEEEGQSPRLQDILTAHLRDSQGDLFTVFLCVSIFL